MIKSLHLNKYYNKNKPNQIHVINDTSIELPNCGLVVFLGKSGSGKTTLLNVLGGLDKASGEITYDDLTLKRYNSYKIDKYRNLNIGYVFQNYNILENETVYDNLKIALNIYKKLDEKEIDKRICYCLEKVGLYKYRKKLASQLSGGEQQRVSIARCLVKNAKIIIADEPTGNLDSKNSIEIMNILSKISKDRLVLLVTHNEDLANFYANRIIKISDGKIISDNLNNNYNNDLDFKDSSNIYLKDLNSKEIINDNLNITFYSDDNNELNLNFKIVKINSKFYLESNQNIEIINSNSHIKLIDCHYEAIKKDDILDYDFNLDNFSDIKKSNISLKNILLHLKNMFVSNLNVKRRTKLGYKIFFVLGAICALAFSLLSMANYNDISSYNISEGYTIDGYNSNNLSNLNSKINELIDNDLVDDIIFNNKESIDNISITSYNALVPSLSINTSRIINYNDNYTISYGSKASEGKICISYKLYEYIAERYVNVISTNIDDIIGLTLKFNYYDYNNVYYYDYYSDTYNYDEDSALKIEFEIVGISDCTSAYEIYMLESDYYKYFLNNVKYFQNFKAYSKNINIVSGRNILNSNEIVLPYYLKDTYNLNSKYAYSGFNMEEVYTVVGYQDTNNLYCYVSSSDFDLIIKDYYTNKNMLEFSYNPNIEILDGVYPTNDNEIILSKYFLDILGYEINDSITIDDNNYIITGSYESDDLYNTKYYYLSKKAYLKELANKIIKYYNYYNKGSFYSTYSIIISSDNITKANEILSNEFSLVNSLTFYDTKIKEANNTLESILPIVIACLIIVCIYSFFMIRSKMMLDIKNIGILRAIGMKKHKFYLNYVLETVILTTITSVFGYLVYIVCFNFVIDEIPLLKSIFYLSPLYMGIGILFLYVLSILFGLLPIFLLLRKTPQGILNKYDI